MPDFVERYFHTGEVAINYADFGGRGRPLLLIHGLSGRWQGWKPVLPALTKSWHVFAVDLRGHGRSGRAEGAYERAVYSKDNAAFIEKVIGGPAYVIGHSLGALVALGVAAGWPKLVKAFVMEDPPLYAHDRWEASTFRPRFEAAHKLCKSGLMPGQMVPEIRKMLPDAPPEAWLDAAERYFLMDHRVWDSVFGGHYAMRKDSDPLLKAATPPALLMQAEPALGAALEDEESGHAMSLLPEAQFLKWPDSGHGMHTAFPERFVSQVEGFFALYR
jgi:pimeloyl-ACP methyl ester carboxylesterase